MTMFEKFDSLRVSPHETTKIWYIYRQYFQYCPLFCNQSRKTKCYVQFGQRSLISFLKKVFDKLLFMRDYSPKFSIKLPETVS